MFLLYPVMALARAPRRTARKKGSGYENGLAPDTDSSPVPLSFFLSQLQIYMELNGQY